MLLKPGGGGSTVITASSRAAASERRVQEKPTRRSKSPTRGVRHTAPPPEYSKPLVKAFEPSQPIWHYGVNKAGYENTFQVLYDDHKNFHLYRLANLYNDVISKPAVLFRDLRPLASGSAEEVVSAIEKLIGTYKE